MGSTLHYIIRQYDNLVEQRRLDISDRKPGVEAPLEFPTFVWVRMLKRPLLDGHLAKETFSLCGKFNSMLEEQLLNSKNNAHRIMSTDIRPDEFDHQGNLTSIGKHNFWHEVDSAMLKFDTGDIKLLPRHFQQAPGKSQVVSMGGEH